MKSFLQHIAEHLLGSHPGSPEKQCIVFPNRRAGLFFTKYLSSTAGKPVWSPAILTINDLFGHYSNLKIAETETLVFELYKAWRDIVKEAESFDSFYFWGEMLLNDFDDIDKYLADAKRLFSNLSELKKIDEEFGGLEKEQIEIIKEFWVNFNSGEETAEKKDFIKIWSVLPELYVKFKNNLNEKGIAYEGMIYREVAEKCKAGNLPVMPWETFHFTGFNALNRCEKVLMDYLRRSGKARFYWDYDVSYAGNGSNHTAGYFIRNNIREFGNDMPEGWNYRTLLSDPSGRVKRKIIRTSSDIAQVKLVPQILRDFGEINSEDAHHTAIVLADENLLVPLLSSMPEEAVDVNITMGYPLKFSPVYSFLKLLLSLQKNAGSENGLTYFEISDVTGLIRHSFLSDETRYHTRELLKSLLSDSRRRIPSTELCLSPDLCKIFKKAGSSADLPVWLKEILENLCSTTGEGRSVTAGINLHNEFIFRAIQVINRLERIVGDSEVSVAFTTWVKLFDRILRGISVPFAGEPLSGIQIMGVLETRALDFKNLVILSVNEGVLPRSSAGFSYIPHNLREAFSLPVIRHQDSVFSYYFYRLLHRAENVVFVYNSNAEGLRTGEMSRFLMQLNFLTDNPPALYNSGYEITVLHPISQVIERTDLHQNILEMSYTGENLRPLSPRAINTWLTCRMRFYYRYVCGIEEPEAVPAGIDPAVFGSLLHVIMQKLYTPYLNIKLTPEKIGEMQHNSADIENAVKGAIIGQFHSDSDIKLTGSEQIIMNVLAYYVKQILKKDAELAPFTVISLEEELFNLFDINIGGEKRNIRLGGIIDRTDRNENVYRILDYKTGDISMEIKSVESLFDERNKSRSGEWLQILIYCEVFAGRNGGEVTPAIYPVRKLSGDDFTGRLVIKPGKDSSEVVTVYSSIREIFVPLLRQTLETIFSRNEDFSMTDKKQICGYCPYSKLCARGLG